MLGRKSLWWAASTHEGSSALTLVAVPGVYAGTAVGDAISGEALLAGFALVMLGRRVRKPGSTTGTSLRTLESLACPGLSQATAEVMRALVVPLPGVLPAVWAARVAPALDRTQRA